jgi:hypothetical protein
LDLIHPNELDEHETGAGGPTPGLDFVPASSDAGTLTIFRVEGHGAGRNASFLGDFFMLKPEYLSRQARNKHKKIWKKETFSAGLAKVTAMVLESGAPGWVIPLDLGGGRL